MTIREDALTLGMRLKAEERETREWRIGRALGKHALGNERQFRHRVADALYHAKYDGYRWDTTPDADELLDNFCSAIFGCPFEDVLEAWDRFLG